MTQVGFWAIKANYAFPFEIIAKLIIPFNIAVTPVYSAFYTISGVILSIVILGIFLIRKPEKYQLTILGLIWYILFSLPNMFVRLDTSPDSYDYLTHRAYLPVIGLIISLITIFNETEIELKYNKIKRLIIFLVLILYSVSSISLSKKYADPITFWTSSIERNPQKAWFHYFLGRSYFKQKDFIAFEHNIRRAITIKAHPQFLYNLGMIYFTEKKSYDSAFKLFNQARATGFTDPEANNNYIRLCNESARDCFEKGEYKKAADRCQIAVDLDPENAICTFNLGLYLMYCDQTKKAASLWHRSIELDPKLKESYRNLYYYYLNNSQNKDSIEYYRVKFISNGGTF
jgi:tetratricopeptide (TPR) repeat protein